MQLGQERNQSFKSANGIRRGGSLKECNCGKMQLSKETNQSFGEAKCIRMGKDSKEMANAVG